MTIFDSLKYPISDKPTLAELHSVPTVIFNEWAMKCYGVKLNGDPYTPQYIYFNIVWDSRHSDCIKRLRKMIAEHDNI